MKSFNGYDEARKQADVVGSAKLPAGAYVCKIKQVRYETTDNGDRIVVAFDVAEGEYKDFFQKQFDENTNEDKKWKGKTNIFVPKDDGSEKDGYTKSLLPDGLNPSRIPTPAMSGIGTRTNGLARLSVSCSARQEQKLTEETLSIPKHVLQFLRRRFVTARLLKRSSKLGTDITVLPTTTLMMSL